MLNDEVLVFDSKVRAEQQVQKIILSILEEAGLAPDGNELSRGLPGYFCGLFNHQILDYYCVKWCSLPELSLSTNFSPLKQRIRKKLQADMLDYIKPVNQFCAVG